MALGCVPKEFLDKELCLEAVKQNGDALKLVPDEFCDKEICLKAVRQNGDALKLVPDELQHICSKPIVIYRDWTETYAKLKQELAKEDLRISL
jgi:hypothetical protein